MALKIMLHKRKKKTFRERYFFASLKVYSPICQISGLANRKPRPKGFQACDGMLQPSLSVITATRTPVEMHSALAEGALFGVILTPASQSRYYYSSRCTDGENYVQ